eukprot:85232-Prymnesium_polylepis.1
MHVSGQSRMPISSASAWLGERTSSSATMLRLRSASGAAAARRSTTTASRVGRAASSVMSVAACDISATSRKRDKFDLLGCVARRKCPHTP